MKHYMYDAAILLLMFLFVNAVQTYFHESIHSDICENFGGVAHQRYNFLLQGGKTDCTVTEGAAYQSMNDIAGYNTSVIVLSLFMFMIFLAMHFSKKRMAP